MRPAPAHAHTLHLAIGRPLFPTTASLSAEREDRLVAGSNSYNRSFNMLLIGDSAIGNSSLLASFLSPIQDTDDVDNSLDLPLPMRALNLAQFGILGISRS